MLLFLDVISPEPKFVLINENKIIYSIYIIDKNITKISDVLLQKYLILEKSNSLGNKLKKLIVCTGPGSYTALRVGISFMYGLSISKNIPLYGVECTKLLTKSIDIHKKDKTFLLICSSNDQNYICLPSTKSEEEYSIKRIEGDTKNLEIDFNKYIYCISNYKINDKLKVLFSKINNINVVAIEEMINVGFLSKLIKNSIIKPIYISKNNLYN